MKKLVYLLIVLIFFMAGLTAGPQKKGGDILVKLNFYEGLKEAVPEGQKIVSTYFLKPLFVGKINIDKSGKGESTEIQKIFNLAGINLMSEAKWGWRRGEKRKEFQLLILNGHEFMVEVTMKEGPDNFLVVVQDRQDKKVLLKTDLLLPEKKSSVFGFEDSRGKPFFLSLSRAKGEYIIRKETPAVKIAKVRNPVLIKKVKPVYPKEAQKRGISGKVVVEAICDITGRVEKTNVISGNPILSKEAVKVIKQWVYEPYLINDKPQPVQFTVVVKFRLDNKKKKVKKVQSAQDLVLVSGSTPAYPQTAIQARVSDNVRMEATLNEKGEVSHVSVISGHPLLTPAALNAVKKWKFKPVIINGKPAKKKINVVLKFHSDYLRVGKSYNLLLENTDIPDIWPAKGYLSAFFGDMKHPLTQKKVFHKGVDIAAKRGSKVVAPASGKVTKAMFDKQYGKIVVIDHGNGYISKYAHLDELKVKKGQKVKKGKLIGLVGNTGQSTAPHLHWEVHYQGKPVNPLKLIKE